MPHHTLQHWYKKIKLLYVIENFSIAKDIFDTYYLHILLKKKYLHDFRVENNYQQQQLTFSVRLPIKDHNHWQESPTELVVNDNVAQLVYPETEHTTGKENMRALKY